MFRTLDRYDDTSLGLPYPVTLLNGAEEETDDETGERIGISIPHLEDLVSVIAIARVLLPLQLDGAEVKFIRRAIGKSAKDFASSLEMAPETYSRWENGKQTVGGWADRQVRMAALILLGDKAARIECDPKSVVDLRIQPRQQHEIPLLTVRYAGAVTAWGMPRPARAA
jgi:transcriptional regulator with XRE-family HTH domain